MHVNKNFVAIDLVRLKKNNQLEDDKRSTPVYVNHVEVNKFETLSALMNTIIVWNVIEKLHGNQLIWVYIYKKQKKTTPLHHRVWVDEAMTRQYDGDGTITRCSIDPSLSRHRFIALSTFLHMRCF